MVVIGTLSMVGDGAWGRAWDVVRALGGGCKETVGRALARRVVRVLGAGAKSSCICDVQAYIQPTPTPMHTAPLIRAVSPAL